MQTIAWYNKVSEEIWAVGGHPPGLISQMPEDLILTMISNRLYIKR